MQADGIGIAPLRLSVSQVRIAAACPRLAYFDAEYTRRHRRHHPRVSRLWKRVDEGGIVGLGAMFHQAVERFHQQARRDDQLLQCLESTPVVERFAQQLFLQLYRSTVPHKRLFAATGAQQQAFMSALRRYATELAEILWYGKERQQPLQEMREQMFGDQRRQVDVSFDLGWPAEGLNVCGRLDYVFFDWRSGRRRIIDYKLTTPDQPQKDLSQISLYALMHDIQHNTQPDAAVLYLHPQRQMIEKSWEEIEAERPQTYRFLASLRAWLAYDELTGTGLKPPGEPAFCHVCPWERECTTRLGPKLEGKWLEVKPSTAATTSTVDHVVDDRAASVINPSTASHGDSVERSEVKSAPNVEPYRETLDDEFCLGTWDTDQSPVKISIEALTMHGIVAGAAGSGKTWTAKVLLEEAIRCGIPVIAVDPQGDLAQLHTLHSELPEAPSPWVAAQREFMRRREVRVWTPGSSIGLRMALDPLRLPRATEALPASEREAEDRQHILVSAAANLVNLAHAGGESESQQTLLMQIMQRLLTSSAGQVTLAAVVDALRDPTQIGLLDADHTLRRSERQKLARMLNNLQHGPAAPLFQRGCALDIETLITPFEPHRTPLNVIYLNHLIDDHQKQFIVAVLANEIYRWMLTRDVTSTRRVVFYVDEARDFLPAGNRQTSAKAPLRRLFSQARKFGICCIAAAQSPRSVEYEALSNCSTKLIGRLESQQDVDRVREWFSRESGVPVWLAARKGAPSGSFVGRWPGQEPAREGQSFRSRPLFSLHQGAWSPDRLESEMSQDPLRQQMCQVGD